MASPSSSATSTPSITVTPDESNESHAIDFDDLPGALVERTRSLTFDLPEEDTSVRPSPERAHSSEATVTNATNGSGSVNGNGSVNSWEPSDLTTPKAPLPQEQKRPEIKRAPPSNSLKLFTENIGKNLSSSNLFKRGKEGQNGTKDGQNGVQNGQNGNKKDQNGTKKKSPHQSGTATPRTPEVRELFYGGMIPDLGAVNRALDSLKEESTPEDDPIVDKLKGLAAQLESQRSDCKKTLTMAMKQRDNGNTEVCRALCLTIVQSKASEIDTKVYALNILSTQASPGQAMSYLQDAWHLIKAHQSKKPDSEFERLLGVIAVLKEGAVAKEGAKKMFKANGDRDIEFEEFRLLDLELAATIPRSLKECPATPKQLLKVPRSELPKEISGVMTPKTEKIFSWAAHR